MLTNRTLPTALQPADTVAVVAPAGRVDPEALERGVETLRARGLRVKVGRHVLDAYGHMAGADRDRASDLMAAFLDPEVHGVFCARGGSGSARMLPYLDLREIATNPKVFVGYSDVTVLHLALGRSAGWPTFYGPMVATDAECCRDDDCFAALWRLISRPEPAGALQFDDGPRSARVLIAGAAEGMLTGGTLCLVESSLGASYQARTEGRLLALEDTNETPWRVDRMLTHLGHAGLLEQAAGFIIGSLSNLETDSSDDLSVEQSLLDHLGPFGKPVLYGFPFGHIAAPLTLPLNCRARVDADAETLTVLEAAVAPRSRA
ncbi:MAG TPA: LD-carboxypeptidase [Armatimonadota bacterium]|nr:LD-carboxypeptidase [Armatimonadota bacterium]